MGGLHLFEGTGIELEYMIVASDSLDVLPVADRVLFEAAGGNASDVPQGELAWSNELVRHVIELKTNGPAAHLENLPELFRCDIMRINMMLANEGGQLMPGGMHPWMDPETETVLWPHGKREIYEAYNRIFDCRGHGWSNLQSMHINLPFAGDDEFVRLHAAIRLILPLLPALAASSPLMAGRLTGLLDNRLAVYRKNQRRIPAITGKVVPESIGSIAEYHEKILRPMYTAIAPLDRDGLLQEEWLNSRGAIARFERGAIEIRVLDVQECPLADLALARLITETLKRLAGQAWSDLGSQLAISTDVLAEILEGCIQNAGGYVVRNQEYLNLFGIPASGEILARDFWIKHFEGFIDRDGIFGAPLFHILTQGSLAERIARRLAANPGGLKDIYDEMCRCLRENRLF